MTDTDILLIIRAADFAARQHVNQRRKGAAGDPYINHLIEVAGLLAEATGGSDAALVAAGLLLVGTLLSIVLILQRGPTSIAAISLGTIAASLLIVSLSSTVAGRPWSALLGKWILIAAASLSAVPLVAWASGR